MSKKKFYMFHSTRIVTDELGNYRIDFVLLP